MHKFREKREREREILSGFVCSYNLAVPLKKWFLHHMTVLGVLKITWCFKDIAEKFLGIVRVKGLNILSIYFGLAS